MRQQSINPDDRLYAAATAARTGSPRPGAHALPRGPHLRAGVCRAGAADACTIMVHVSPPTHVCVCWVGAALEAGAACHTRRTPLGASLERRLAPHLRLASECALILVLPLLLSCCDISLCARCLLPVLCGGGRLLLACSSTATGSHQQTSATTPRSICCAACASVALAVLLFLRAMTVSTWEAARIMTAKATAAAVATVVVVVAVAAATWCRGTSSSTTSGGTASAWTSTQPNTCALPYRTCSPTSSRITGAHAPKQSQSPALGHPVRAAVQQQQREKAIVWIDRLYQNATSNNIVPISHANDRRPREYR